MPEWVLRDIEPHQVLKELQEPSRALSRRIVQHQERALAAWVDATLLPFMAALEESEPDSSKRWEQLRSTLHEATYREQNYGPGGIPVRYDDD